MNIIRIKMYGVLIVSPIQRHFKIGTLEKNSGIEYSDKIEKMSMKNIKFIIDYEKSFWNSITEDKNRQKLVKISSYLCVGKNLFRKTATPALNFIINHSIYILTYFWSTCVKTLCLGDTV